MVSPSFLSIEILKLNWFMIYIFIYLKIIFICLIPSYILAPIACWSFDISLLCSIGLRTIFSLVFQWIFCRLVWFYHTILGILPPVLLWIHFMYFTLQALFIFPFLMNPFSYVLRSIFIFIVSSSCFVLDLSGLVSAASVIIDLIIVL